MAAEDDKLSINRRRLFQALSAAPVVATLRPGEALARNSSYQCAVQDMGTPDSLYYLADESGSTAYASDRCSPAVNGCYLYEQRTYWGPFGTSSNQQLQGLDGFILVDAAPLSVNTSGLSKYFLVDDTSTPPAHYRADANDEFQVDSETFRIDQFDSNGDPVEICIVNTTATSRPCLGQGMPLGDPQQGLFLAIGEPDINADGQAETWIKQGVWPDLELNANTAPPGTDRLAGTCLDSFGAVSSDHILAKG